MGSCINLYLTRLIAQKFALQAHFSDATDAMVDVLQVLKEQLSGSTVKIGGCLKKALVRTNITFSYECYG